MLHDKIIAENFIHHAQKDRSLSPPTNSPNKMDLYNAYRFQVSHQLHRDEAEVLDLSRRCDSVETPPPKTPSPPSPYQNRSPNDELSTELPTTLATNIQKMYAQHSAISSTAPPVNSQNTFSLAQRLPIYPMYYPAAVKRENEISSPTSVMQKQQQQLPVFSSNYHQSNHHLLQSINLIKAASYPSQQISPSALPILPQMISPKLSTNKSSEIDEQMSSASSIPGSPSSSSQIEISQRYSKSNISENQPGNLQMKPTRPFKAFPRDPLVIAANFAATDVLYDNPRVERYTEYRKRVLEQIRSANGGERTVTNPKMRRTNNRANSSNSMPRSDESNSDGQLNNSESEDRTGDSDNESTAPTITTTTSNVSLTDTNNTTGQIDSKDNQGYNQNSNVKDAAYFERRRKNNAAAKKSRDRRRIKEDEIAIRAAYLERQNIELLCQLDALKAQIASFTKCQS